MNIPSLPSTPHLITAYSHLSGELEGGFRSHQDNIENRFRQQFQGNPAPLNTSAELLSSGYKLPLIDTNLFPADANNLNPHGMSCEPLAFAEACPPPDKEL